MERLGETVGQGIALVGDTPLQSATRRGCKESVQTLSAEGAN
jgi:hypothetical protein